MNPWNLEPSVGMATPTPRRHILSPLLHIRHKAKAKNGSLTSPYIYICVCAREREMLWCYSKSSSPFIDNTVCVSVMVFSWHMCVCGGGLFFYDWLWLSFGCSDLRLCLNRSSKTVFFTNTFDFSHSEEIETWNKKTFICLKNAGFIL